MLFDLLYKCCLIKPSTSNKTTNPSWLVLYNSFFSVLVEAQKLEKISLQHIQDLLHRVEEVVGLLTILVDHQYHILASTLTQVNVVHWSWDLIVAFSEPLHIYFAWHSD